MQTKIDSYAPPSQAHKWPKGSKKGRQRDLKRVEEEDDDRDSWFEDGTGSLASSIGRQDSDLREVLEVSDLEAEVKRHVESMLQFLGEESCKEGKKKGGGG